MIPQIVTTPMNPNAAIKSLTAKAAHNGQWMAILLEWKDPTKSDRIVLDEFGDQVAVERPVHYKKNALPSPMMGNPGGLVNIWQWRAAFQHDIDKGEPQVRDLYPNADKPGIVWRLGHGPRPASGSVPLQHGASARPRPGCEAISNPHLGKAKD